MNKKNLLLFVALANAQTALVELEEAGKVYGLTNTPYYMARRRSLLKQFEDAQDAILGEEFVVKAAPKRQPIVVKEVSISEETFPSRKSIRMNEILEILKGAQEEKNIDILNNIKFISPRTTMYRPEVNQWLKSTFDIYFE